MNYSKCLLLPLQILGRLVTWGLSFVFPCPRIGNRAHSRQPWTDSPASNIEIRLECNYLKTGVAVRFLCHLLYRYKKMSVSTILPRPDAFWLRAGIF